MVINSPFCQWKIWILRRSPKTKGVLSSFAAYRAQLNHLHGKRNFWWRAVAANAVNSQLAKLSLARSLLSLQLVSMRKHNNFGIHPERVCVRKTACAPARILTCARGESKYIFSLASQTKSAFCMAAPAQIMQLFKNLCSACTRGSLGSAHGRVELIWNETTLWQLRRYGGTRATFPSNNESSHRVARHSQLFVPIFNLNLFIQSRLLQFYVNY
jgi:hypothetical protein